jgi:hypothetical protein
MHQVMDGMHSSFNLLLPISFMSMLENVNFLMVSLPINCLVNVTYPGPNPNPT